MKLYIQNFLKYNIHIGHSASSSLMLSSWFFFKLKKRVWIINIFKTIIFLKFIFKFLSFLVNNEFPFWFINFEYSKEHIFKAYASICGEFACTKKWIRGFLSNFKSIQKAVKNYALKSFAYKKSIIKAHLIKNWVYTRYTWPRGIFLSNIPLNYVICKEASDIVLPVVAMVDTNIKSYLFHYPIPSNDDSLDSICYIINILSKHILLCKYKKVLLWYNRYKVNKIKYFNLLQNLVKNSKLKNKNVQKLFSTIVRNQNFSKMLNIKLFSGIGGIRRGLKGLFIFKFTSAIRSFNSISSNSKFLKQIKFAKKINIKNAFLIKILKKKKKLLNNNYNPLKTLKKTASLNNFRKKKKKLSYFSYIFLTKLIKKTRIFHESFIINKPSNYYFLKFFKKSRVWVKNHVNTPGWCYFRNYKIKLNPSSKDKWLNNKFNKRLLDDKISQKMSHFSDSALILNTDRWVYARTLFDIMRKFKHTILNYWLIPFIKRNSVKIGYRRFQSKFFYKEDNNFKRSISWKLSRFNLKAPVSTLNYYSNWFFNLLNLPINKRRKNLKKKIKIGDFVI